MRSLTESAEAMDSLAQALIPGIIAGLSTNKSLQATLVEKVTSRDAHAPLDRRYDDTRTYALTRTDTRDPVPSNAAGSASQNSNAAGVSHNSNAAGPSNAAQWNNLPPLTGYPWPMPGFPTPLCGARTHQCTVARDHPQLPSSQAQDFRRHLLPPIPRARLILL